MAEKLEFLLSIDPDASKVSQAITAALGQAAGSATGGSGVGGGAAGVVGGIGKALSMALPEAAPFIAAITGIVDVVGQAVDKLIGFAAKAAPGVFAQMNVAIDDLQAVIGRTFVPMLEILRDAFRFVGDALATVLPTAAEVKEALGEFTDALHDSWDAMRDVIGAIGPLVKSFLIEGLKGLAHALRLVLAPLTFVLRIIGDFLRMVGLGGKENMSSSQGAAARPASFRGFEDYSNSAYTSSYSVPGTPTANDIPKTVNNIDANVSKIVGLLSFLPGMGGGGKSGDPHNTSGSVTQTILEKAGQLGHMAQGGIVWDYLKNKLFG